MHAKRAINHDDNLVIDHILLEKNTDLKSNQKLLRHNSSIQTKINIHICETTLINIIIPLDSMANGVNLNGK